MKDQHLVTIRFGALHNEMLIAGTAQPVPMKANRRDRAEDARALCSALGIGTEPPGKKKRKRNRKRKPKEVHHNAEA